MPEHDQARFAAYLEEVDSFLAGLPARQRQEIRRELQMHLEDAAAEDGLSTDNQELQERVIDALGPGFAMGIALYEAHQGDNMLKRLFDICFSTCWLILLSPLFVIVAVLIKLDTRGPIFYRDHRVGRNGRRYVMYKFRSMNAGDNSIPSQGPTSVGTGVTRVGGSLRKAAIDELPQLWNVLKGDMSIVGPRPAKATDINMENLAWRRVLQARPGITGPAFAYYGPAHTEVQQRLEADSHYLEKQSLGYDLQLLQQTWNAMRHRNK